MFLDKGFIEDRCVGRYYSHPEDLLFSRTTEGKWSFDLIQAAITILNEVAVGMISPSIKWDGSPTVYWGREPDGTFVLVGKNGWGRSKSTSSKELHDFIMSTGKGEEWRQDFADSMAEIFEIVKASTPDDQREYFYGDILFHPNNTFSEDDHSYKFTPNKVTYEIDKHSELGRLMSSSKVGIAIHQGYSEFGNKTGRMIPDLKFSKDSNLFVVNQIYVNATYFCENLSKLTEGSRAYTLASTYKHDIYKFLRLRKGLSDLNEIFYRYFNHMFRTQQFHLVDEDTFVEFLKESKVSIKKQEAIKELIEIHEDGFHGILEVYKAVCVFKDKVIEILDQTEGTVTSATGNVPGGEGYIVDKYRLKLVPRLRWHPN